MSLIISIEQARKAFSVINCMTGHRVTGTFFVPNDLPNDTSEVVDISLHDNGEIVVFVRNTVNARLDKRRVYPSARAFYDAHFD